MQSAFSKHLPTARVFVTLMKPKRTILVFGAVELRARGNLHVFEVGQVYLLQAPRIRWNQLRSRRSYGHLYLAGRKTL